MKLIGALLVVMGIVSLASGNGALALTLSCIGGLALLPGKPKRSSDARTSTPPATYWSSITGKSHGSQAEMRRAEGVHLANVYSDPRSR